MAGKPAALSAFALMALALLVAGCNTPSKANIQLRKQVLDLENQAAGLQRQHVADAATIDALQNKSGIPPAVSRDRLEKLFTVHGLRLGFLTGGFNPDSHATGDSELKVYAVPFDQQGDALKASGTFAVSAFDLAAPNHPLVGEWKFDLNQSMQDWYGQGLEYTYVLKCPWQTPPAHAELTVRVTFVDELTGREFVAQKVCKVRVPLPQPPTSAPASQPLVGREANPAE